LLQVLIFGTHGFAPLADLHLNPRRRNPRILLEREFQRTYHRVARWLMLRSDVRGAMAGAWLWGPETAQASPHLDWLRRVPSENGAFFSSIGEATPDSGFLSASRERQQLHAAGEFKVQFGFWIWPRKELIQWARDHPEFGE
jgi:hypothetical protein